MPQESQLKSPCFVGNGHRPSFARQEVMVCLATYSSWDRMLCTFDCGMYAATLDGALQPRADVLLPQAVAYGRADTGRKWGPRFEFESLPTCQTRQCPTLGTPNGFCLRLRCVCAELPELPVLLPPRRQCAARAVLRPGGGTGLA